jgi:1-aminocyclopropane-1-carboxylate deaminase/D-cysteine desulfhydrase-like pyridoxal-dependent ACC family enzyme
VLRRAGVDFSVPRAAIRIEVVDAMGRGYGHPTPEGESARSIAAEHGVRLDPTYGAKAFGFFLRRADVRVQRAVFWHTFAWP